MSNFNEIEEDDERAGDWRAGNSNFKSTYGLARLKVLNFSASRSIAEIE